MGERCVRIAEAGGSNPPTSTNNHSHVVRGSCRTVFPIDKPKVWLRRYSLWWEAFTSALVSVITAVMGSAAEYRIHAGDNKPNVRATSVHYIVEVGVTRGYGFGGR